MDSIPWSETVDPSGYSYIQYPMWTTEQEFQPTVKERDSNGVPGITVGTNR